MTPLRYAVAYAVIIDFVWLLSYLDKRGRNGFKRVQVEEEEDEIEDVVVVTGGSSGLGQIVAEMFALKGITVAILDIKRPQMEGNYAIQYYECDVSDHKAVERVASQITEEVFSSCHPIDK